MTAPAAFSLIDPAYCAKYGVDPEQMREAMTHVAWKNHVNGARNPVPSSRPRCPRRRSTRRPGGRPARRVRLFGRLRRCGRHPVIVRAEDAHRYTDHPIYVKGCPWWPVPCVAGWTRDVHPLSPRWSRLRRDAYRQAGITDPVEQLSPGPRLLPPTEIVLMEDLGFTGRGQAWKDVLAGEFDADGRLPVNIDGGWSFGHPVGASGLRMLFEAWLNCAARQASGSFARCASRVDAQPGRTAGRLRLLRRRRR